MKLLISLTKSSYLRYVLDGKVKKVFVDFVYVERITGENLARAILQWLATWNLLHSNICVQL